MQEETELADWMGMVGVNEKLGREGDVRSPVLGLAA